MAPEDADTVEIGAYWGHHANNLWHVPGVAPATVACYLTAH